MCAQRACVRHELCGLLHVQIRECDATLDVAAQEDTAQRPELFVHLACMQPSTRRDQSGPRSVCSMLTWTACATLERTRLPRGEEGSGCIARPICASRTPTGQFVSQFANGPCMAVCAMFAPREHRASLHACDQSPSTIRNDAHIPDDELFLLASWQPGKYASLNL